MNIKFFLNGFWIELTITYHFISKSKCQDFSQLN